MNDMENVKALFIDCDGVLYDQEKCSYDDIVNDILNKTLAQYDISMEEFNQTRAALKEKEVRGLYNSVLDLCNRHRIKFDDFAIKMANNTGYSQIPSDTEMLDLLKKVSEVISVYIVTNNTAPHLVKIFDQLRGKSSTQSLQEELNIYPITIEKTLAFDKDLQRTIFDPKQMKNQFKMLCAQEDLLPEQVTLIDDTERIRKKAEKQGLHTLPTEGPEDTKRILKTILETRRRLHEKSIKKRSLSLRQTCGGVGR